MEGTVTVEALSAKAREVLKGWIRSGLRVGSLACLGLTCQTALAGSATYDFNSPPPPGMILYGNAEWRSGPYEDEPGVDHTGGVDQSGYVSLFDAKNSRFSAILFPDHDLGQAVAAFTFEFALRVGNPIGNGGRPADGFSVSFARANDPVVSRLTQEPPNYPGNDFAGAIPEAGTRTGLSICFDSWSGNTLPDGSADIEGVIVRVDNVTKAKVPMTTRNGACNDPSSIQTGPYDFTDEGSPDGLCWANLKVDLEENGQLTVKWKEAELVSKLPISFAPSAGRLVIAGRTGGANQNVHLDNVRITTYPLNAPGVPRRASATARVAGGRLVGIDVADGGFEYSTPPVVQIVGGGGAGATATATVTGQIVTAITVGNPGTGYTSAPQVVIAPPPTMPAVSLAVSRVRATLKVVAGRTYQMQSSNNLKTWLDVGSSFVAAQTNLVQEFDVDTSGRYFRVNQLP
jgi:hypothetical protein